VTDGRWRISTRGGVDPQWSRDGRELYYIADRTLMSVAVKPGATFAYGAPQPLFRMTFNPESLAFGSAYAPSPDGRRFLVNEHIRRDEPALMAAINWSFPSR
jgi:Tol biopolymer transport system component